MPRFDPTGAAGDNLAMCVVPGTSDSVGYVVPANPCTTPYSGGTAANGYTTVTLNFTNFGPGEGFNFSADVDPTSIKGFTSAGNAGALSGLELAGTTATVTFTDGTQSTQTFGDGSQGGSLATVPSTVTSAVGLSVLGVTATDGGYSNSADTATVTATSQTAVISGPAGTAVKLIVSNAVLEDAPPGGFNDLDPIERNKAVTVTTLSATIGAGGTVNVPFAVSATAGEATYIMAAATGAAGLNGPVTAPIYLELAGGPPPGGGAWSHVGTGALVAGTGTSLMVPLPERRPGRRPPHARLPGTQQPDELVGDRLHQHHRSVRCRRAPRRGPLQVGHRQRAEPSDGDQHLRHERVVLLADRAARRCRQRQPARRGGREPERQLRDHDFAERHHRHQRRAGDPLVRLDG